MAKHTYIYIYYAYIFQGALHLSYGVSGALNCSLFVSIILLKLTLCSTVLCLRCLYVSEIFSL